MIFHVFGAAIRAGYAKIRGYSVFTPPDVQEIRIQTCEPCLEMTDDRQCRLCGCFVDAKTSISTESCPKRKWRAIFVKKFRQKL